MTNRTVLAAFAAMTMAVPFALAQACRRSRHAAHDCHAGNVAYMARFLGGSEVGFEISGVGVFHGPNLTPDKATGLGDWTDAQIVAAIQKGRAARPKRRPPLS